MFTEKGGEGCGGGRRAYSSKKPSIVPPFSLKKELQSKATCDAKKKKGGVEAKFIEGDSLTFRRKKISGLVLNSLPNGKHTCL